MPFLAPIGAAIAGAVASAGTAAVAGGVSALAGAGVNALTKGLSGNKGPESAFASPQVQQAMEAQQAAAGRTTGALNQQQGLADQLAAQGGIQNQSDVYAQQQALAGQLGAMAQGAGPNPALAQLQQATGQNVASQAALAAGQRGAGANAGLIARQAAQSGAGIQQQAVGQAAQLQAQQQLNAIGALQQQQGMLGNLATTQVGQQTGAIGNLNQYAQGAQGLAQQNQAQMLQGAQANQAAQQKEGQYQQTNTQQLAGGISSGIGSAIQSGITGSKAPTSQPAGSIYGAGRTDEGGFIKKAEGGQIGMPAIMKENYKGKSRIGGLLMAEGGMIHNMEAGGHVPGKAEVGGAKDSYKNDTVKALLSPGEIVLPRSVTQSKDPAEAAKRFVAAIKARKGK